MHTISSANIANDQPMIGEEVPNTRGFIISIVPPVHLNPDIVEKALHDGSLAPKGCGEPRSPFGRIALIGSTHERTVLYARLFSETNDINKVEASRLLLLERTAELVHLMGSTAIDFEREEDSKSPLV